MGGGLDHFTIAQEVNKKVTINASHISLFKRVSHALLQVLGSIVPDKIKLNYEKYL